MTDDEKRTIKDGLDEYNRSRKRQHFWDEYREFNSLQRLLVWAVFIGVLLFIIGLWQANQRITDTLGLL